MKRDNCRVPENWPSAWRKEYLSVLTETPAGPRNGHIYNAAARHLLFCETFDQPLLACPSIVEHDKELRRELSKDIASAYAFALARIAWAGRDKALWDELYEHFLDKRTARQLLEATYVPRQARLIGLRSLERQEICRQAAGGHPARAPGDDRAAAPA